MVKCPHCGMDAMGLLRKAGLGPGRTVACQSCGKMVSSHPAGILAAIPAFLGSYNLMKSESLFHGIAALAIGLLLMGLLQTFAVPLVRSGG